MCLLPHGTAHLKDGAYREGRATSADGAANLHDGAYAGGAGPQGRRLRFFLTDKALLLYGRQFFCDRGHQAMVFLTDETLSRFFYIPQKF
jgi:hypothetical protein